MSPREIEKPLKAMWSLSEVRLGLQEGAFPTSCRSRVGYSLVLGYAGAGDWHHGRGTARGDRVVGLGPHPASPGLSTPLPEALPCPHTGTWRKDHTQLLPAGAETAHRAKACC